jgi:hypothetical protein
MRSSVGKKLSTQQRAGKTLQQLKITVDASLVAAFKARCEAADTSMTTVLSTAMASYIKKAAAKKPQRLYTTRRQRKMAVGAIVCELRKILEMEEQYKDNFPSNLVGSKNYELAEAFIDLLEEVAAALTEME